MRQFTVLRQVFRALIDAPRLSGGASRRGRVLPAERGAAHLLKSAACVPPEKGPEPRRAACTMSVLALWGSPRRG